VSGSVVALMQSYGYVALFALVGFESLGVPLPGETALVAAAALAGAGRLSLAAVIGVAAMAAIAGDSGGYWIGRTGGLRLVQTHGHWLRLSDAQLQHARRFFVRHGAKTVFFGRFVAILRTWVAFVAGVSGMPYKRFMLFNVLGGTAWACTFGAGGYLFGRHLPEAEHQLGQVKLALLMMALVAAAAWFAHRVVTRAHVK
jgi:membrane protein DedA with SNARE-associated domain